MKIKEIKELSVVELQARKREIKKESFHLRLQQQTRQIEKTSQILSISREITRNATVLSQLID